MSVNRTGAADAAEPVPGEVGHMQMREMIDAYLDDLWRDRAAPDGLLEGMRYATRSGKRIRAMLSLAVAHALGHAPRDVLPIGSAIELIHACSLVHDDLPAMDDASHRRGRETCHVRYGEGIAVLIGDALFSEALHVIVTRQSGGADRVNAALCELLRLCGPEGIAGGQYLDLTGASWAGEEALREMAARKTGDLVRASVTSVAAWAQVDEGTWQTLDEYSSELGQLYQIVDDLLDVAGTVETTGKTVGVDAVHGRRTHVADPDDLGAVRSKAASTLARVESAARRLPRANDVLFAIPRLVNAQAVFAV